MRSVACLLRLSQSFVDPFFKRIARSRLGGRRRNRRRRRIGRCLDLLSVWRQPVIDGFLAVRELLAAWIPRKLLQRPVICANVRRCAFLAAAALERLIEDTHRRRRPRLPRRARRASDFSGCVLAREHDRFRVRLRRQRSPRRVRSLEPVMMPAAPVILVKSVLVGPVIFVVGVVIILRRICVRRVLRWRRRGAAYPRSG